MASVAGGLGDDLARGDGAATHHEIPDGIARLADHLAVNGEASAGLDFYRVGSIRRGARAGSAAQRREECSGEDGKRVPIRAVGVLHSGSRNCLRVDDAAIICRRSPNIRSDAIQSSLGNAVPCIVLHREVDVERAAYGHRGAAVDARDGHDRQRQAAASIEAGSAVSPVFSRWSGVTLRTLRTGVALRSLGTGVALRTREARQCITALRCQKSEDQAAQHKQARSHDAHAVH